MHLKDWPLHSWIEVISAQRKGWIARCDLVWLVVQKRTKQIGI